MLYCHKCGEKLPEGAKFCPTCAEPISATPKEDLGKKSEPNSVSSSEVTESGSKLNPVTVALVWLMVICGAAWFLYSANNASTSSNAANATTVTTTSASILTTAYTNTTANVRTCASSSCTVFGTYPPNTGISLSNYSVTDVAQLPKWVAFTYTNTDGSSITVYISNMVLSDTEVSAADATQPTTPSGTTPSSSNQQSQNTSSGTSGNSLSPSLIAQIEPSVVEINCYPPNYSTLGTYVLGSGVSVNYAGTNYIETNYHVYDMANTGGGSPSCYAVYPEAPNFTFNAEYGDYHLILYGHHYDPNTYEDIADFTLGAPLNSSSALNSIPTINDTSLTGIGSGCSAASVGDSVTIFGYPASGNALGISETVTQGTIAGIVAGPIYKFDGAIDHGNSGGLAVLDKDICDLGVPTLGVSGLTAGIGYIQSVNLVRQSVTESDGQVCQDQYGTNSVWTGTTNAQGGPICDCASGYTWNAANTGCVATLTPDQICQRDVGAGSYYLGYKNSNGTYACSNPY